MKFKKSLISDSLPTALKITGAIIFALSLLSSISMFMQNTIQSRVTGIAIFVLSFSILFLFICVARIIEQNIFIINTLQDKFK